MRPGTDVTVINTPSGANVSIDSGTAFAVGLTDRGPLVPVLSRNLNQWVTTWGSRQAYSYMYDWVEAFFKEGGARLYMNRVVGPGATIGTKNLLDSGSGISLTVNAIGPGAWSSSYKVQVIAGGVGGSYRILVLDASNNVLEDSGDLIDQQSAVAWSQYSNYVRVILGATTLNPAVAAAAALTAGNDDRGNITDAQWQTALDMINDDLGPGQVVAPGRTTDTGHSQLLTHALNNNRAAVLDHPNTPTLATLEASSANAGGADAKRFAAAWSPWGVIPGLTRGTIRTVPISALICGLIARNEPSLGPDQPSAGNYGRANFFNDLSQPSWNKTDMQTLNAAGVNVVRRMNNEIRVFGWRSLVDPINDENWLAFSGGRFIMAFRSRLKGIGDSFTFEKLDGLNGKTINRFKNDLTAACLDEFTNGNLFGDSAEEAYMVDMSDNTTTTMQNLELHATVAVKISPFAEWVPIQLIKRELTEVV